MNDEKHAGVGACVFDAYGTLIDFGAAVETLRDRLGEPADRVNALWRQKQLEYTWLRSLMGRHADFWQVTGEALDYALAAAGVRDEGIADELMGLYRTLPAYSDAAPALEALRAAGMRTAILSNGAPEMLQSAASSAGLTPLLDAVFSVEAVRVFKPHPSVYQLAADAFDLPPHAITFMSANGWDIAGAGSYGFRAVWVNRGGAPVERLPFAPSTTVGSLAELPALLGL
jgi:2-haloacid dehalogenase